MRRSSRFLAGRGFVLSLAMVVSGGAYAQWLHQGARNHDHHD